MAISSNQVSLAIAAIENNEKKSWNDILSNKILPKIELSHQSKIRLSNALFGVALIQSIPILIIARGVYKSGHTEGLSKLAIFVQLVISSAWISYGFMLKNIIIMTASILLICANVTLLVLIMYMRNDEIADSDKCELCGKKLPFRKNENHCGGCNRRTDDKAC